MSELFGTDGVRGEANSDLTPELAFKLGRFGAWHLAGQGPRRIIIGKDTRLSGDMLEAAASAGAASAGIDVLLLGVMPTPAVAWTVARSEMAGGIVVSASHNPFSDNGIKFFTDDGCKLSRDMEAAIERDILSGQDTLPRPQGREVGKISPAADLAEQYIAHLQRIPGGRLDGLKIVLDCANGAASGIAPRILEELGASVVALHSVPDGLNINERCGSLYPEALAKAVLDCGGDIGLALDGDADRLVAADDRGCLLDGDDLAGLLALQMRQEGTLPHNRLVMTVMSNLGLERALAEESIFMERTDVGDRNVAEAMLAGGAALGGEQSGHIIISRYNSTGDGLATALDLLRIMRTAGRPLSELRFNFERWPQALRAVNVVDREAWRYAADVSSALLRIRLELGSEGRVLVRASGTESKVRIMLEGRCRDDVEAMADDLAALIGRL